MTGMQLGITAETEVLKNAVASGCLLGAVYGIPAVVRRLCGSRLLWFVCDLLYSAVFGAVYVLFTLSQTGYYRGFVLAGMLAGMLLWHISAGRLLVFAGCAAVNRLVKPLMVGIYKICRKISVKTVKGHTNFRMEKKMSQST